MKSEWDRLRSENVWDESIVRDWHIVAKEAKDSGKEVNLGYIFGICSCVWQCCWAAY